MKSSKQKKESQEIEKSRAESTTLHSIEPIHPASPNSVSRDEDALGYPRKTQPLNNNLKVSKNKRERSGLAHSVRSENSEQPGQNVEINLDSGDREHHVQSQNTNDTSPNQQVNQPTTQRAVS